MRNDRATLISRLVIGGAAVLAAAVTLNGCRHDNPPAEADTEVAVHVGKIVRTTLHRYVAAYGRIEPEPAGVGRPPARAIIGAPVSGLLTRIRCAEGQRVARGALLFELDSRTAEVAVTRAQTALDYAERTLARQRELLDAGGTSQRAVQDAEQLRDAAADDLLAARNQLDLLRISAPVAGTVVRIDAALGQPVEPNTVLAEVIDLDRLVVEARVPSVEAAALELGQQVELAADGAKLGQLVFIGRKVDAASDTVLVRGSVAAGPAVRPGQFFEIRIVTEEIQGCLAVPEESVVTRAGEGSWIVLVAGDTTVRQPVSTGLREDGLVEVTGTGLEEGAVIVTDDAYSLPADTKVRIASS